MNINVEYELNRAWVYNEEGEIIGETNFIVPADWLADVYKTELSTSKSPSLEEFLETYEPESKGEYIYKAAKQDKVLIEDLGVQMYERS